MSHGGRGLMDARIEQPIAHINTTIGHIRRGGKTGNALEASLTSHQVVAGIGKSILDCNTEEIPYLPEHTQWGYMSKIAKEFEIRMIVHNEWISRSQCENDKVIMDVACTDKYFERCRW